MKTIIAAIAILALALPVHAQLGSQSFGNTNFSDTEITESELQAAESSFGDAGLLPDNPFYGFKRFGEGLRLTFTFDEKGKEKLHLEFAKTRLAEAKKLSERGGEIGGVLKEYSLELQHLNSSDNETNDALDKSRIVLTLVLERVPESARPAIERALNNSVEKKVRINVKGERETETEMENERNRTEEIKENIHKRLAEREEKAAEQINEAVDKLEEAKALMGNEANTTASRLITSAVDKLEEAREALAQNKTGEAFGQANAAEQLAKNAKKMLERENERDESRGRSELRGRGDRDNDADEGNEQTPSNNTSNTTAG